MKLAFLSNDCLMAGSGGVQICTQEFLALFRAIDPCLKVVAYKTDQGMRARLKRRLWQSPYHRLIDRRQLQWALATLRDVGSTALLLNNSDALALAPTLRRALPGQSLVYPSHGPVVTDVVNTQRLPLPGAGRRSFFEESPGKVLDHDLRLRRFIDATISISGSDDLMESWLGSPVHAWIPRQISVHPQDMKPLPGRVGCVSTLNHAPNHDGLVRLATALDQHDSVTLRLVGGPEPLGRRLSSCHPSIDYLGRLSDEALVNEMSSWRGFVNPIFCPARGSSMKVKTALEQGLPVLTTPIGARGYTWDPQALPLSASPEDLADQISRVAFDDSAHRAALAGAARIAALAEPASEMIARIEDLLRELPTGGSSSPTSCSAMRWTVSRCS